MTASAPLDPLKVLHARGYRQSATVRMLRRVASKSSALEVGAHARIVSVRDDGRLTLEGLRQDTTGAWTLGDRKIVGPVSADACVVVARKP